MKLDAGKLKARLQPQSALAITLESDRMRVRLVRKGGERDASTPSLDVGVGSEDVSRSPEKAGQTLLAALIDAGVKERRCVISIPVGWALTTSADLPRVGTDDLRSYLELQAEREFSIPASDLRLGYYTYSLPDSRQRVLLAAVQAKRLQAVEKMMESCGRKIVSISLALDQCLALNKPMLHFLANGNHVDVVVTAGGGVAALRSLPVAGASDEPGFDSHNFCREIRITLGRLPEEVRKQVTEARFSGPPASARALCAGTRGPLEMLGLIVPEPGTLDKEQSAGAAEGSALLYLSGQPAPFEFVIREPNRFQAVFERFDSKRRRWIIAGAVGLFLLPLLILLIRSHYESSLQAEWDGMKGNVAEVDGLQQKIRLFRPWFESAPQSLRVIESLIAAFPERGDVWAKSIQIGDGYKVSCSGFARNQVAWLGFLDHLRARPDVTGLEVQQLRGDTNLQFSITYKWAQKHEG